MYLGLDIGTTATKAILVDAAQIVIGRSHATYPTSRPGAGLSEQDPELWIDAVRTVLADLRGSAPRELAAVRGIGLSGQMHSLVTLGRDGKPLAPAILWNDTRGADECRMLLDAVPDIGAITGVVPMPSFTAAKLLWVRRNDPARFAATKRVLWPKDYVRLWMTGELATDVSDASGGQLLDGASRRWATPVLNAVGLDEDRLPPLLEATEVAGRLRLEVAEVLGLTHGTPVAAGGGDAGTGALGLGCVSDGAAFISLGTGATVVVAQNRYAPRPEFMLHDFAHAAPGLWYQMAAMLNGASCLAWVARLLGEADIPALLDRVAARHNRPSRILFLPYLTGERTPHNDAEIRGSLIGLDATSDPLDVAQAVLEGVAFSITDGCVALARAGVEVVDPGLIGGGARSLFWGRLIATVLGRSIYRYEDADLGPALGAARLGLIATGRTVGEAVRAPSQRTVIDPDLALTAAYAERHLKFRAAYAALRDL